jgi:2-polyprenyl-3-methyl-5-hydroxy-6-metoxy-1,4-benzoquinol methylase
MARYEAEKVISNVENMLVQNDGHIDDIQGEPAPTDLLQRSVTERLHFSIIPSMRSFQTIGKIEPGTRLAFPKKILARLLRMISAPQSAYNQNTTAAAEVLAETLEHTRKRLLAAEETIRELRLQSALLQAAQRATPAPASSSAASDVSATPAPRSEAKTRMDDYAYLEFQRRFRGEESELRQRMIEYVPIIKDALGDRGEAKVRLLDIACGDGILMDVAREQGWETQGVDLNSALAEVAKKKGLSVELADALGWLQRSPANAWDVVTCFQFVEHLTGEQLEMLLAGVARVLAPNGIAVFETLNPHTLKSLQWFHLDPTHVKLMPPETLSWLAERAGLQSVGWRGVHPVPADQRLPSAGDGSVAKNFERLDEWLHGNQDYYLIARKPKEIEVDPS